MRALYYAGRGIIYLTAYLVGVNLVVSYTGSWFVGGAVLVIMMFGLEELLDRAYRKRHEKLGRWSWLWLSALVVPVWVATAAIGIVPSVTFTTGSVLRLFGGMLVGGAVVLAAALSIVVIRFFRTPPEERGSLTS